MLQGSNYKLQIYSGQPPRRGWSFVKAEQRKMQLHTGSLCYLFIAVSALINNWLCWNNSKKASNGQKGSLESESWADVHSYIFNTRQLDPIKTVDSYNCHTYSLRAFQKEKRRLCNWQERLWHKAACWRQTVKMETLWSPWHQPWNPWIFIMPCWDHQVGI